MPRITQICSHSYVKSGHLKYANLLVNVNTPKTRLFDLRRILPVVPEVPSVFV